MKNKMSRIDQKVARPSISLYLHPDSQVKRSGNISSNPIKSINVAFFTIHFIDELLGTYIGSGYKKTNQQVDI